MRKPVVATHQKTQQGLKLRTGVPFAGITNVATHQKTQQGLKQDCPIATLQGAERRNASENPTGIETLLSETLR